MKNDMGHRSILIVDDLPDNLRVLRDTLQAEGYKVRSCTTGAMALRGAKAAATDLILLDIKLPDYDGYEVCRQLKADEKTAHIPVIFLSALNSTLDKVQGFAVGGADYITKPFQIEEVLARVETHLSIQRLQKSLEAKNLRLQQEIAEHQRTQAALFYEKELAQVTLKSIGDAVITTDAQGYVTYLNPIAESLTGWHQKEAQGLHLFEVFQIINAITKEPVKNPIIQALEQVKIVNLPPNTILIARNGQQFPIDDSVSPIQDSQGQVIGAAIVFKDITDYKRQEEAKLNNILNRAIAAITSYRTFPDRTCIYDYWSPGCEILFGYTAEELIADPNLWKNHVHPEDLDPLFAQIMEGDQMKTMSNVEYRFRHKDGTWHWILASLFSEWDQTHNCWFVTGVLTDITQRKNSEIALKEAENIIKQQEEQFRLALELTKTGIWNWDITTGIIQWNPSHYTLLGYQPGEVISDYEAWRCRLHPDDVTETEKKLLQAQENHTVYTAEYRVIHSDGSVHWLLGKGQGIYDQTGKAVRMMGTIIDISDRKRSEIALREEQKKLSLFVRYAPVSVAMFDREMRYLNVSQRWLELYQLDSMAAILGRSHYEVFPNIPDTWKQIHQECLAGATQKCDQDSFILPDGSVQWLKWEILPWRLDTEEVGGILIFVDDITERKQAEMALQETQESLMIAIEAAQMGTWYLDLINDVSSVRSLRHDQIFGYDTPQIEWGEAIARRHILEADRKIWDDAFARAMKTGKLDFEVRVQWPDGSIHWMAAYGRFYFDENGKPLYGGGVNLDITERKQAEIALKERMARERLVTNITQNIRQTLDLNEVLQRTVDQVREFLTADRVIIFRFQPDWTGVVITESVLSDYPAILSRHIYDPCFANKYIEPYRQGIVTNRSDFYADDIQPCYRELMASFQARANLAVPLLEGDRLWGLLIVHQCSAPRQWQTTEIELLQQLAIQVGIAIQQSELYEKTRQELLDRQKAERKIAEQAVLIDIATDGIFVQDLEQQIVFWNQGAERLYGWTTAEAIGQKTQTLFNQDDALNQALQITMKQGSWQGEIAQGTKSNKKIILASRWTLVKNESGQPKSILSVNSDITEKKQLEKQFYHVQRLESIGTLASGIAHDFNNILTPILGISQLLPLRLTNVDQKTQELLSTLTTSTRRAVNLVKQILLFSRASDGEFVVFQLRYLFRELIGIAKQTFPKSIEISDQSPTRELWTISADRTQMDQVFMNLMINARDAMPEGGSLTISAENRYLDEHYALLNLEAKPGPYVVVTVSDTGSGIPSELLERIFDPFFTTKEVGKGTGLGLSTVMGIVKNHGGFIRVTSELGKGTEFEVFLPAIQGEIITTTLEEEMPSGNGELILIVEDESSIQEITKTALEKYNYRILLASDGIEALAIYAKNQAEISVVLMDMMMPNLDGFTAIRALKKMNLAVKIIGTSGILDNKQLALQADAQAFLLKPYTISQLLKILKEVNY